MYIMEISKKQNTHTKLVCLLLSSRSDFSSVVSQLTTYPYGPNDST